MLMYADLTIFHLLMINKIYQIRFEPHQQELKNALYRNHNTILIITQVKHCSIIY